MTDTAPTTDQVLAVESTPGDAPSIDPQVLTDALDYIRPALQADGGDVVLLGVDGGTVSLQLIGACGGCPMATLTLSAGIERILRDRVPGFTEVVAV